MTTFMAVGQVAEWLEERGLLGQKRYEGLEEVDHAKLVRVRFFGLPGSASANIMLGDILAPLFEDEDEVLLYVDGWGEPPDYYADAHLFDRFRQALGEKTSVQEKPGNLFYPGDYADLLSMLRLMLLFGWGANVIASSGKVLVRIFDYDCGELYASDPALLDQELLDQLDHQVESN